MDKRERGVGEGVVKGIYMETGGGLTLGDEHNAIYT